MDASTNTIDTQPHEEPEADEVQPPLQTGSNQQVMLYDPATSKTYAEPAGPKTLAEQVSANEYEMYQRTQQFMSEIEEEVRQTQVLVAKKEAISLLVGEYDKEKSPKYHAKAEDLATRYSHVRKIRGDGNCFYRAVLTAELERCMQRQSELDRFAALCRTWRTRLFDFGFPELTTGDFCDAMDSLLDSMKNGTKSAEFLFDDLNNDSIANYYVAFTRLITSGYLREQHELYSGFIEGERSLEQYCAEEIEPMWKDCDHVAIIALVAAIGVPIRIEYMDQSQAPNGGWHHDVGDGEPQLHFLYRPGHYDILYRK